MKSIIKNSLYKSKIIIFSVLGIGIAAASYFAGTHNSTESEEIQNVVFSETAENHSSELTPFNPNELSAEDWQKLGFSEKQTSTILKYKDVVGGNFTSKEQLAKCYAISEKKFDQIEPYILLPEKNSSSGFEPSKKKFGFAGYEKKEINVKAAFNPDHYSESDWQKLGFTVKQSAAIIKYKNYLGGSFQSKEKFRECFIISDENYRKIEPYLLLPAKSSTNSFTDKNSSSSLHEKHKLSRFDPNELDADGWRFLGFSEKQAEVILNYKNRNLKGSFQSVDEIAACFVISKEKFDELYPYIELNPANFIERKNPVYTKSEPPKVKTDFSKTELNSISNEQLQEFGFSPKAARNYVEYRNKMGGFVNKNQIFETYDIDRSLAEKLIETVTLKTDKVEKYTLFDAPESWLKTHPYFRYSADKIIYYRLTMGTKIKCPKTKRAKTHGKPINKGL